MTKDEAIAIIEEFLSKPAYGSLDITLIKQSIMVMLLALRNMGVPDGCIIVWRGSKQSQLPAGYQLCDGTNGSPDLSANALTFIMKNP